MIPQKFSGDRANLLCVPTQPNAKAVPNVVYTCGAMRHGDQIILPYAISDTFSNFATIEIAALKQAVAG